MAFRLSQKAFGQLLKSRALTTTSSRVAFAARSSAPQCSRAALVKAFSTTRVAFNDAAAATSTGAPVEGEGQGEAREQRSKHLEPGTTPQNGGRTVFFGNLPFFTDKDAFQTLLQEFGAFENVRWLSAKNGAPICHVTFADAANASALVDSSAQEPFYYGGRELRVSLAVNRPGYNDHGRVPSDSERQSRGSWSREGSEREPMKFPPSPKVYFKNFVGSTSELREFLGEHAQFVNSAFFSQDRATGEKRPVGIIQFVNTDRARECIKEKRNAPGPDGQSVYLRFASVEPFRPGEQQREAREQEA